METKYRKPITITLGRLTCKRVSDILDQLDRVDAKALSKARAMLPAAWARVINARANMTVHPTRPDLARKLGITEAQVAYAEIKGLYRLCSKFAELTGRKVTARR